jgi:hypothetical protein
MTLHYYTGIQDRGRGDEPESTVASRSWQRQASRVSRGNQPANILTAYSKVTNLCFFKPLSM